MSVLSSNQIQRVKFDISNPEHRADALLLIKECRMGAGRFFVEPPFTTLRDMVLSQMSIYYAERDPEVQSVMEAAQQAA